MLIDRETVMSGKAAQEPWKFYDLGHGYCAYDFFDQCPHRMAGALQLRQEILLNDAELAAVDDGVAANTLSMVGRTDLIEDYLWDRFRSQVSAQASCKDERQLSPCLRTTRLWLSPRVDRC